MTTAIPPLQGPHDATAPAVPPPLSSSEASESSRHGRPVQARTATAILILWGTFLLVLSLIRVLEQLSGSASGARRSPAWVLLAGPWVYCWALACGCAALVLAVCSATLSGRLRWAAVLLLLDGPFVLLLANGLLGGPLGGRVGSAEAFARYHRSLSALSLVG